MKRRTLAELEQICQKPDYRVVGNWMARRINRPLALRITWLISPWGVSASTAMLSSWGASVAAAVCFAWGTPDGWLLGAVLLQLGYFLDFVDGQLARLNGTASLDGAQLDYLMHHTINLLVPLGVGIGLFVHSLQPWWFVAGLVWAMGALLITLQHDARYKAFIKCLKRYEGRLEVVGGGGGRPSRQPPLPRRPDRLLAYLARKACEAHVVMNVLTALAVGQWLLGDESLLIGQCYLALMVPISMAVAAWTIGRSFRKNEAEREFSAWFREKAEEAGEDRNVAGGFGDRTATAQSWRRRSCKIDSAG